MIVMLINESKDMTVRPSDFWPTFKREWYSDETGELVEPHRSRLIANGTTYDRIMEMEAIVQAEIAEFHRKNAEMPLVNGKNWAEQELEQRYRRRQVPRSLLNARYNGTYDPDRNYE
jgi:hypothetical protein